MNIFKMNRWMVFITFTGALGGLLFGYNVSVISGVLLQLIREFNFSVTQQANIVSILVLGAFIGAIISGYLSDWIGRKNTTVFTMILYIVGGFVLIYAQSAHLMFIGRLLTGLAVGLGSLVIPLYLSEIAPPKIRGAIVTVNQLAITVGILLAYIMNYCFDSSGWRILFVFSTIVAFIQGFFMLFLPETPKWLALKGYKKEANRVCKDLGLTTTSAKTTASKTKKTPALSKKAWKTLYRTLYIGIAISIFQQITGINTIIYYAPTIFQETGLRSDSVALLATVGVGGINVLATIFSMWLLDVVGRRPVLIAGTLGMFISLLGIAIFTYWKVPAAPELSFIAVMVYIIFFAIGLGPVTWLVVSEIFPIAFRGKAMGACVFSNWASNYLVTLFFLPIVKAYGISLTFSGFAVLALLALIFFIREIPETKGKTLEEIESHWKNV